MELSVIIPMLNEEEICGETYRRLSEVLQDVDCEFLFIDDGSTDRTKEILESLFPEGSPHRVISFSRNFGHQAAFSAGIDHARGDCAVIIDGDLQDPPELILEMMAKWKEGYEVVYAQRKKRQGESFFKLFTAKWFYRILDTFTNVNIPVDTGDFRLMDRKVIEAIKDLPERSRFLRGLVPWVGFRQTGVQYDRAERTAGETKYPLSKMLRLALNGITSFSVKPLHISFYLGLIASGVSLLFGIWALVSKFFLHDAEPGWTSVVIVVIFLGGVQLISIGIIGEYIGRIYEEVKQRPLYILKSKEKPHDS